MRRFLILVSQPRRTSMISALVLAAAVLQSAVLFAQDSRIYKRLLSLTEVLLECPPCYV
jgi:glucose-6-phosphate-specific signal transduction histidine kinase